MPDAHISLLSFSLVLPVDQHSVYEVLQMDARKPEPHLVFTDFAEAEQVEIAFGEAFPQDASIVVWSLLTPSISWWMPTMKQHTFRLTEAVPSAS